jgi:hypothetical protein
MTGRALLLAKRRKAVHDALRRWNERLILTEAMRVE